MTEPRGIREQRRRNRTKHRRAMEEPEVRELVDILRRGWVAMGFPERGKQLCALATRGCSTRGLGRELKQSATSIRRHMEIAGLPQNDREAIEAGASAKAVLAQKATSERRRRTQERAEGDRKTGALSDKIATDILEFCRSGYDLRKAPMTGRMFPILLNNVESLVRNFEATGHRAVKASKKLEPRELFRRTRPRKPKNASAILHQAKWLAEFLWLIVPESEINDRAIVKARKRASELLPKRTPRESFDDTILNSKARNIELSNIPPRKFYPGGAGSMPRQGQGSLPPDPKDPRNTGSKS